MKKTSFMFILSLLLCLFISLVLAVPSDVEAVPFSGFDVETNGSAVVVGGVLQLTPALNIQSGSAFIMQPFFLTTDTSFSSEFQFQITGGSGGADGIVFIIHSAPLGPQELGGFGIDLGYSPISPSIAVEFDTWLNGGLDPNDNHIGIDINGDLTSPGGTSTLVPDLNSGSPVYAWVDYNGANNLLEVFVDSTSTKPSVPQLSYIVDIPLILGSSAYYAGFSAGTGGLNNVHEIVSWSFASEEISIPALSQWGMIIFMFLAAIGAVLFLRRKRAGS